MSTHEMTDQNTRTHEAPAVSPVPDGYTSITPYLCVDGAAAAIDFYTAVFGARLVSRNDGPGGTVAHAELDFGNGRIQLSDPAPDHNLRAPGGSDAVTHSCVHTARTSTGSTPRRPRPGRRGTASPRRS